MNPKKVAFYSLLGLDADEAHSNPKHFILEFRRLIVEHLEGEEEILLDGDVDWDAQIASGVFAVVLCDKNFSDTQQVFRQLRLGDKVALYRVHGEFIRQFNKVEGGPQRLVPKSKP